MQEIITLLANKLAVDNKVLTTTPNSVLEAIDVDNSSNHLAAIAREISNKINNELILVKNKIRPFMVEVVDETKKLVDSTPLLSIIDKYNIKEFSYPDGLNALSNVLHTPRAPNTLGTARASIPIPEKDLIKECFLHTNSTVNTYLSSVLVKANTEYLENLWSKYLLDISSNNNTITELSYSYNYKVDDIILLYVALDKLNNDSSLKDTEKEAVGLFYSEIINYLSLIKQTFDTYRNIDRLIIKIENNVVEVDSVVYKKFLDAGLTQEVLLGMAAKNVKELSDYLLTSIKTKAEEYREAWSNFVKVSEYSVIESNVNRHKTAYDIIFDRIYNKDWVPNDLKEFLEPNFEVANKKFRKFLDTESTPSLLSIDHSIREIFGSILFVTTNFKRFADGISDYSRLNPNCTPADAATFAALEFFLDYMLEQLVIGSVNGIPTL